MASLAEIRDSYIDDGLAFTQAEARTAQDVMLDLIAKSSLSRNATVKGGVLMQHVSKDSRRATTDFDLDFVRYPITDKSIHRFVAALNGNSGFSIAIEKGIEELKHQDYSGKRIHIVISDAERNSIKTKVDIGVHTLVSPELEEVCFDLGKLDESVTLLADSNEQVVAEKLKSLLKIGAASTRYKDVFDIYYLLVIQGVRQKELDEALAALVFDDDKMREQNHSDITHRLSRVLNDRRFKSQLSKAKNDWLGIPPDNVVGAIISFFS